MTKIIIGLLILWLTVLFVALEGAEHHSSPARVSTSALSRAAASGMLSEFLPFYRAGQTGR